MAERDYLVDTSAIARAPQDPVGERLLRLAEAGRLWTCRLLDLEIVYAARARDVAGLIRERQALPKADITPAVMNRALQVAGLMSEASHHRGAKGRPTSSSRRLPRAPT